MKKTQQSMVVFNTPAVHGCHGWKLGEYLTMGKVIISTPISNRLPAPLINGQNILIVNNPDEMRATLSSLLEDKETIAHIQANNRDYYQQYVKPSSVIKSILNASNQLQK